MEQWGGKEGRGQGPRPQRTTAHLVDPRCAPGREVELEHDDEVEVEHVKDLQAGQTANGVIHKTARPGQSTERLRSPR